jgi:hypothetical protein
MWGVKNAYRTSDRKSEGRITPDRPSCGWEYNIKIYLNKQNMKVCTVFVWLSIVISGGLL